MKRPPPQVELETRGEKQLGAPAPPAPKPSPLCFHEEDKEDHKCFEACNAEGKKFATKGIENTGNCPANYNTVDTTKTVLQCPDGVTNVRYCSASALNVTIATKGEAGEQVFLGGVGRPLIGDPFATCYHNESNNKCYEACSDDDFFHGFQVKGLTAHGECPSKYNSVDEHSIEDVCDDGVTSVKYCQADKKHIIKVRFETKGEK